MKLKNVIACLAVLSFVSGSTCAMAKNVDNQQKVEKQDKVEKKNNKSSSNVDTKKYKPMKKTSEGSIWDWDY